ncbi:MauE/DoxX family redox-associated membrane protein [Cloacibacterium sp.]|uniref:MauE/DoxX family redox-associated membrane protein n=1 Tax=Cloacibacterium sp. TaxID=1913682 RepID=UPI0039E285E3
MNTTAFFFLRLPIALSLLGHGLVRIPKLQGFSNWMVGFMEKSYLPKVMIVPFSYVIPFVEVAAGLLLLIGLFTQQSIYVSLLLMALLIFGSTTIENWEAIPSQLIHAIYLIILLFFIDFNSISIDNFLKK